MDVRQCNFKRRHVNFDDALVTGPDDKSKVQVHVLNALSPWQLLNVADGVPCESCAGAKSIEVVDAHLGFQVRTCRAWGNRFHGRRDRREAKKVAVHTAHRLPPQLGQSGLLSVAGHVKAKRVLKNEAKKRAAATKTVTVKSARGSARTEDSHQHRSLERRCSPTCRQRKLWDLRSP